MKTRIFIVEDHHVMRDVYRLTFEMQPDFEICGAVSTGAEALAAIGAAAPDLVLVDVSLPGMSGIELVGHLQQAHPTLPVLVVSGHHEAVYAERALEAGARGYLDKQHLSTHLLDAMRLVLAGEIYLSDELRARL